MNNSFKELLLIAFNEGSWTCLDILMIACLDKAYNLFKKVNTMFII